MVCQIGVGDDPANNQQCQQEENQTALQSRQLLPLLLPHIKIGKEITLYTTHDERKRNIKMLSDTQAEIRSGDNDCKVATAPTGSPALRSWTAVALVHPPASKNPGAIDASP